MKRRNKFTLIIIFILTFFSFASIQSQIRIIGTEGSTSIKGHLASPNAKNVKYDVHYEYRETTRPYIHIYIVGGVLSDTGRNTKTIRTDSQDLEIIINWNDDCSVIDNALIYALPSGFASVNFSNGAGFVTGNSQTDTERGTLAFPAGSFAAGKNTFCTNFKNSLRGFINFTRPTCLQLKSYIEYRYGKERLNCCDLSDLEMCSAEVCNKDTDNDGVFDCEDQCPNESGGINGVGGCPEKLSLIDTDLTIVNESSSGGSETFLFSQLSKTNRLPVDLSGSLTVSFDVANLRGFSYLSRPGSQIEYFISNDNSFSNDDYKYLGLGQDNTDVIPSINSNSRVNISSIKLYIEGFILSVFDPRGPTAGNKYLLLVSNFNTIAIPIELK